MKKTVCIIFALLLMGCNGPEVRAIEKHFSGEKIWVFLQFNVPEEGSDIESYYYYAKISDNLYQSIAQNSLTSGFILLEEIKYWGKDDLIHEYKNGENTGDMVFRIEDIRKIDVIAKEPVAGKGVEQFEEPVEASENE